MNDMRPRTAELQNNAMERQEQVENRPGPEPEPAAEAAPAEPVAEEFVDDVGGNDIAEGHLEVIGFRGPIVNALQYYVLVLFMVGLVLACLGWIPFICGRAIVALNPVRAMLYVIHMVNQIVDKVIESVLDVFNWALTPVWPFVVFGLSLFVPDIRRVLRGMEGMALWDKLKDSHIQSIVLEGLRQSWAIQLLFPFLMTSSQKSPADGGWLDSGWLDSVWSWLPGNTTPANPQIMADLGLEAWERTLWQKFTRYGIRVDKLSIWLKQAAGCQTLQDRLLMILLGHVIGILMAWVIVEYMPRGLRRTTFYGSARMSVMMAKIVFFVGIEMVAFPVMCGLCLLWAIRPIIQ